MVVLGKQVFVVLLHFPSLFAGNKTIFADLYLSSTYFVLAGSNTVEAEQTLQRVLLTTITTSSNL